MTRQNILVIKLSALGDFIQALGPMAAIRKHHTNDHITLLTTKPFESLARSSGYFDKILIDNRPKWYDVKGWLNLKSLFNKGKYTRVYDLQNNDRTAFYLKLFSPSPEWVGAASGASHRNVSPQRTTGKAFDGHVQTLSLAGIADVNWDNLEWMKTQKEYALTIPYVLIVPGGSPVHPEKRWPASSYALLCKKLLEKDLMPVLLGGKAEEDVTHIISQTIPGVTDLTGQTALFDIPHLARSAYASIGNDTGPMHLITPTGCPSLVLFSGKSNPVRHAPLGEKVRTLQENDLSQLSVEKVWNYFWTEFST